MKVTFILAAFAALVAAVPSDLPEPVEFALDDDVHFQESDLIRAESGLNLNADFTSPHILAVSTTCAAQMRPNSGDGCPTTGHLSKPGKRTFIQGITFQRCANTCTCRDKAQPCMAFAWHANTRGKDRGRCIMYGYALSEMGLSTAPRTDTDNPTRDFYSRTCYHKVKPSVSSSTTGVQTKLIPRATPVAKRDDVADGLVAALERI